MNKRKSNGANDCMIYRGKVSGCRVQVAGFRFQVTGFRVFNVFRQMADGRWLTADRSLLTANRSHVCF